MDLFILFVMLSCGAMLGYLYFAGLLKTLQQLAKRKKNVNLVMLGSFLVRSVLLAAAFYVLMNGDWQRLLALTAGFMIVRLLMVRQAKTRSQT